MFLDVVTKTQRRSKNINYGYKVFAILGGALAFESQNYKGIPVVKRGVWLKAEERSITYDNRKKKSYLSGFHFFTDKYAAELWRGHAAWQRVVRVKVRGIHTYGTQFGHTVGVAREMRVPVRLKRQDKKST